MPLSPKNRQEEIASRFIRLLKDEYVVVGKSRIPFWKAGLLLGVCLGIIIAFSYLASRSGDLQQSRAATTYTLRSGSITPSTVAPSGSYTMKCDYGAIIDCIGTKAPSGSCAYSGFEGTAARFACTAGSTQGTFTGQCITVSGTAQNCANSQASAGTLMVSTGGTPPPPSGSVYQASTDFSGTQGNRHWRYSTSDYDLTYYSSHAQCNGQPCWRGQEDNLFIAKGWMHPGATRDAILNWEPNTIGSLHITGTAKDANTNCGDGVNVSIRKNNSTILWQATIVNGDITGKVFDITVPFDSNSDKVSFVVNKGGVDIWCDATYFDPKIEFGAPATDIYQASADFSGNQGYKNWFYLKEDGTAFPFSQYYSSHAECGGQPCWRGSQAYQVIGKDFQQPGITNDSIRAWETKSMGSVRVTGTAKKTNTTCGDGVNVIIRKGYYTTLWRAFLDNANVTQKSFDISVPVQIFGNTSIRDRIFFIVNKGAGNNSCDNVYLDPKIVFSPENVPNPLNTGTVTVNKTVLSGGVQDPTILLDGFPPTIPSSKHLFWDNVSPGRHTLTVTGAAKVFYAACPGRNTCLGNRLREGTAISFLHTTGADDTIEVYSTGLSANIYQAYAEQDSLSDQTGIEDTTELYSADQSYDKYVAQSSLPVLKADSFTAYNMPVGRDCRLDLYASGSSYLDLARASAGIWSGTGIKVNILPDEIRGSRSPSGCDQYLKDEYVKDRAHALRFGNFDLGAGCPDGINAFGRTFYSQGIWDTTTGNGYGLVLYPDITVDAVHPDRGPIDKPYNRESITRTISHEIGHVLGLRHNLTESVMNPELYNLYPTNSDILAVQAIYSQCVPKPPELGPQARLSFSFSPNPATFLPRSGIICDGREEVGQWFTNVTIKAMNNVGVDINEVTIKYYDTLNRQTASKTWKNVVGWGVAPLGQFVTKWYITPLVSPAISRAEMIVKGTDSNTHIVTARGSLPLPGTHMRQSCSPDPGLPFPIAGFVCGCECSNTCDY